jgi:hypothetical protein
LATRRSKYRYVLAIAAYGSTTTLETMLMKLNEVFVTNSRSVPTSGPSRKASLWE